jgi:hypothetical protein
VTQIPERPQVVGKPATTWEVDLIKTEENSLFALVVWDVDTRILVARTDLKPCFEKTDVVEALSRIMLKVGMPNVITVDHSYDFLGEFAEFISRNQIVLQRRTTRCHKSLVERGSTPSAFRPLRRRASRGK